MRIGSEQLNLSGQVRLEGGALDVDIMERIEARIQHGGDGVEALYREVEQRVLSH